MRQLLILHALLKSACFFPEETFPSGEVSAFEKRMLQDSLDASERLDHVSAVVVKVPEFSIVLLMRPPERILLQDLVLLEVLSDSPALVIC